MSAPPHLAEAHPRVLFVGWDWPTRERVRGWLTQAGHECHTAGDADEALALVECGGFGLAAVEVTPGTEGLALLARIRAEWPNVASVAAAAASHRREAVKGLELGAVAWLLLPVNQTELVLQTAHALEGRRLSLESQAFEHRLEEEARVRTADIRRREEELALRLVSASEYRDNETGAHIRRIGLYSGVLADALGWDRHGVDDIRIAATMHDIGKIGVPDTILLKPGKLTVEEFEVIKRHTVIGAGILDASDIPLLNLAKEIALAHHEKWDGTGYPAGLAGEAIPESARIVAISDVYDALVNERVYKPALSEREALKLMVPERGRHFDPRIFDCFLGVLPRFRDIRQRFGEQVGRLRGLATARSDCANGAEAEDAAADPHDSFSVGLGL
jgi:putative two-component system response regulator